MCGLTEREAVQKSSSSKAADGLMTGAYGTVREDDKASRTPLATFFNSSYEDEVKGLRIRRPRIC